MEKRRGFAFFGRGEGLFFQLGEGIGLGGNFQLGTLNMGVNLGRIEIFMAQNLLDCFDVHAVGEHQRGSRVAQLVG